MSILIIGGNGYIGSRLYEYLKQTGHNVDNIDLCWFGQIYSETIKTDFKNLSSEDLKKYSHIILLAGHSSVSMSIDNIYSCFNNNVLNFVNLVDKINNDQILIYASTCAVYGKNDNLVNETYPLDEAKNIYDYSFICRENIVKFYPNKKIIGLRFGSVNGFSKNIRNENLLNSLILSSLEKNQLVVSNGDSFRSILGLNDLCRVIECIVKTNDIKNNIYNITSVNDTIMNFALKVKELTGSSLLINDSFKTDYSFNCSSKLFENDYNFKFLDNTESIFNEITNNYNSIVFSSKRKKIIYE